MMTTRLELCDAYGTLQLAETRIVQLEEALYNQGSQPSMELEQA